MGPVDVNNFQKFLHFYMGLIIVLQFKNKIRLGHFRSAEKELSINYVTQRGEEGLA